MRSTLFLAALLAATTSVSADAQLRGSRSSVLFQHRVAQRNDFTFLRTARDVREFVEESRLAHITSTPNVLLDGVSFPYARPAVKLFLDRLGKQYRARTGERLVVTSLVRPISRQPDNASALSVHPTGMAVDLRIPSSRADRVWLERTLLSLEDQVVLDVTKERHPAHYHVAVFPREYTRYVAALDEND
jgi:hypothetical protein